MTPINAEIRDIAWGIVYDVLKTVIQIPSIDLIFTSPPYADNAPKDLHGGILLMITLIGF